MFLVKKVDAKQQIVTGEVFAPNVLDSHGDMMTRDDVEKMAHRFLERVMLAKSIDHQHDNVPVDAYPVESFIARDGDPDYTPGAWVLSVKVANADLWTLVEKGEINGFSFEAWVSKVAAIVDVEMNLETISKTEEADGHWHFFFAQVDDDGRVVNGRTSTVNNHSHEIKNGTATEESAGHSHRIFV